MARTSSLPHLAHRIAFPPPIRLSSSAQVDIGRTIDTENVTFKGGRPEGVARLDAEEISNAEEEWPRSDPDGSSTRVADSFHLLSPRGRDDPSPTHPGRAVPRRVVRIPQASIGENP